jgi:hypothetical protein
MEPQGGFWIVTYEPDQRTADAMLTVAPETYDWRLPDVAATMRDSMTVDLAPPEGTSWN